MFDDKYVDYDNATEQCHSLGARYVSYSCFNNTIIIIRIFKNSC